MMQSANQNDDTGLEEVRPVPARTLSWSRSLGIVLLIPAALGACRSTGDRMGTDDLKDRLNQYRVVRLTADLSHLSANEQRMIQLFIEAAEAMDDIFWMEAYGDKTALLEWLGPESDLARYAMINYGPWDRLAGNAPFVEGIGAKPEGANFYPPDMTKKELEAVVAAAGDPELSETLTSLYTMVRRDAAGRLTGIPYHRFFADPTERAARKLEEAASLAEDAGLRAYLTARASALRTDEYRESDRVWLDMKTNGIDIVIGPIETYEDQLFGRKAAHEAYVLIKDKEWSRRLSRYAALLPELQRELPVEDAYKQETPGTDSDLNAYDVIYYAGDCNAGSKTIAINLPNDETVQLEKGTRRLQLKNAMRAKFDEILVPIADELIAKDQRRHITFDAFFGNTMFHEVAHGLGIKNTINGRGTVREALKEQASALEEGKADILGLHMVTKLFEMGELKDGEPMDNYVTFLAGIFRSVRFGGASAHGRANMLRFNFFRRMNAFAYDGETGTYRVSFDDMTRAVEALSAEILKRQGDGDYAGVVAWMEEMGRVGPELQRDLDRLAEAGIPVDIVFEQGLDEVSLPALR